MDLTLSKLIEIHLRCFFSRSMFVEQSKRLSRINAWETRYQWFVTQSFCLLLYLTESSLTFFLQSLAAIRDFFAIHSVKQRLLELKYFMLRHPALFLLSCFNQSIFMWYQIGLQTMLWRALRFASMLYSNALRPKPFKRSEVCEPKGKWFLFKGLEGVNRLDKRFWIVSDGVISLFTLLIFKRLPSQMLSNKCDFWLIIIYMDPAINATWMLPKCIKKSDAIMFSILANYH